MGASKNTELHAALDALPLLVWTTGPDRRCDFFNRAWLEHTGRTMEQELGDGWHEGVHPDDVARCAAIAVTAFEARKPFAMDYRLRRRDGVYHWVRVAATPRTDADGAFLGYVGTCVDVHEQLVARESARATAEYLRALVEEAPVSICMLDLQLRHVAVSKRWREMLGLPADLALDGVSHYDVFPELSQKYRDVHQRALAGEVVREELATYPSPDGTMRYSRWECGPWHTPSGQIGGITIWTEDITDSVAAVSKLGESEERFRQMADAIDGVFWLTSPDRTQILYISSGFERIWQRSRDSVIAEPRSWIDAVHVEDRERVLQASINGLSEVEYRIVQPGGSLRWIRDRAFPIRDASGTVVRVAALAEDITARRALEEQLRHAQKLEAVGQLAGGIAHDFNNTLTVIQGSAELVLEEGGISPTIRAALGDIRNAAEHAAALTKQLLVFGRKQPREVRTLDLNALVTNAAKLLGRLLPENVQLEIHTSGGSLLIRADATMLEQVVLNLAINARDAMPAGGVLSISTAQMAGAAVLVVRDNGHGILPEHLEHIFEPFFTTKEVGKGSGLGLATVHGIVEQHGGSVQVESQVGRGTTFRVTLPLTVVARPARVPTRSPLPRAQANLGTILVVEDDPSIRRLAKRILERGGYQVRDAADASEAIAVWGEVRDTVSLVITDVVMPGSMTGFDLAMRLREERPTLRVIFSSGYSGDASDQLAQLRDGDSYLPKPYDSHALLESVATSLAATTGTRA